MKPALINQDHPSFGCEQAYFLFALQDHRGQSVTKLFLVETTCAWAVQTMERLLLKDGFVSNNCFILSVHRDCGSIGIRAEILEQVSYVDFMLDIVDSGRLLADALISTSFHRSLTEEEKEYATQKIGAMNASAEKPTAKAIPKPSSTPVSSSATSAGSKASSPSKMPSEAQEPQANSMVYHQLMGGLIGMGFKKAAVKQFVERLGSKLETSKLNDLMRQGISELAA